MAHDNKKVTYRRLQRNRKDFLHDLWLNEELDVVDSVTNDYMFTVRSHRSPAVFRVLPRN